MRSFNAMTCAGLVAAGVMLAGCSEDDNIRSYPSFPGISSIETANKRTALADLSGDGLAYQAALLYELVLNDRAFDQIDRPVDAPLGTRDCAIGGFAYHNRAPRSIWTSFGDGTMNVSHVVAYGCTEEENATTERMTLGQFSTALDEVPCADGPGLCEVAYSTYGGDYTYGVQYLTKAGAGPRSWQRVEIRGYTTDGAREVEIDGVDETVAEQRQNLLVASSVATLTAADTVDTERVLSLQYGEGDGFSGVPFVLQRVSGNRLHLDGLLSSGAMGDNCTGGRFTVDTDTLLTVAGSNIVAGTLTLKSGSGASAALATLNFQANGDVEAVTDDGTETLTRGNLQGIRDECFQTVAVKR